MKLIKITLRVEISKLNNLKSGIGKYAELNRKIVNLLLLKIKRQKRIIKQKR